MAEITMRAPREDDWPNLLQLADASLSEMPDAPSQQDWLDNRRSFPHPDGFQQHFVAARGERIVGYAAIERRNRWAEGEYRLFVVVEPSDLPSLGRQLFAMLRERLLELGARRAWFLEYAGVTRLNSFLVESGFVPAERLNLADGSTVIRSVLDSPFEPGVTPTWPNDASVADRSYGQRFAAQRMAANYLFRPPYSPEVYRTLLDLFGDRPRRLLDAGCGPGKVTFGLIDHLDRVDAVDPSAEMLRVAKSLPGADRPNIRWIHAPMEDAPLDPPYGLAVAGMSVHWMDVDRALPRIGAALAPGGFLALTSGDAPIDAPWEREATRFMIDFLGRIRDTHLTVWKTMRQQLDGPILMHRSFRPLGHKITAPFEVSQSIDDFLRCEHSRASWSEEHLGEKMTAEFDSAMTAILSPYAVDGLLKFEVQTRIEWGRIVT